MNFSKSKQALLDAFTSRFETKSGANRFEFEDSNQTAIRNDNRYA